MPPKKLSLTSTGQYELVIPKSTYRSKPKDYSESDNIKRIRMENDLCCYYHHPDTNGYVLDKYGMTPEQAIGWYEEKFK